MRHAKMPDQGVERDYCYDRGVQTQRFRAMCSCGNGSWHPRMFQASDDLEEHTRAVLEEEGLYRPDSHHLAIAGGR